MPARRFFVQGAHCVGSSVELDGSDAHKIANVLRLRQGDVLEIVDSAGTLFDAELVEESGRLYASLKSGHEPEARSTLRVDVAQAVPKGAKMDYVIEKATELGAGAVIPFTSERSVVRDGGEQKLQRWRRLAAGAAQQCGRRDIPRIDPVRSFGDVVSVFGSYDVAMFAWELAPRVPLLERLGSSLREARTAIVVIGPEGGFSHAEADFASESGADLVWLGPRILRSETAALALLAVIEAVAGASAGRN
jgi:16S rRNA (uracil1498-N3)-methyltransferase